MSAARPVATTAEDLRLARLHLRLGMIDAARAELEDLGRRGALDPGGQAALAEARWRRGDLEAAAEAARAHLEAGGDDQIAIVVAAEAAAAAGRPVESQALVQRAALLDLATLDAMFAGMPRRAYWPAAGSPPGNGAMPPPPPEDGEAPSRPRSSRRQPVAAANGSEGAAGAGIASWVEPARPKGHADPTAELETARDELDDAPERGLLRLALVLRLDPSLAPDVLEAVRLHHEPAALVIRGDAQRLLGRHLEAEAEFAEAAEIMERDAIAHARRSGHHAREDS